MAGDITIEFQFHKGPIKARENEYNAPVNQSFNSIKVRLKPAVKSYLRSTTMFQFHKGPIKAHCIFR